MRKTLAYGFGSALLVGIAEAILAGFVMRVFDIPTEHVNEFGFELGPLLQGLIGYVGFLTVLWLWFRRHPIN